MGFLTDLVGRVRSDLDRAPLDDASLMARAMASPPARDLAAAVRWAGPGAVIAEVKRSSPSVGAIADVDAGEQARRYASAGAAAISVLTERRHFDGSLADLRAARAATTVPVLRKDFIVHPSQVIEARAAGADAVLLIAAAVTDAELKALVTTAFDLGVAPLVETHSEADLDRALATEAELVGVNARDLETLEVDVRRALGLLERVPDDRLAVMESGIATRSDVERAVAAGAAAVLVGEALMRADDAAAKLCELRGVA
jgi:indole-3-glycerol phosphate synthase